ncbi:hydrolase CocE/NonD family protein [Thozetella sp. PMI_491]|nr:hydrolase CocE/NonD family protein [Thozetella sp. PMI_491]
MDSASPGITSATLRIYGDNAYPVPHRRIRPTNAPRARYAGFKQETLTLRAGSIRREGARPLTCDILFERDVAVTLRDGTTIYTDVFRPPGADKIGGPWLDDIPYRSDVPLAAASELQKFEGPDPAYWVAHGYAVLNPDTRGAYASEGNVSFFGRQLAEDGYDFIEWAATQLWSSGRVSLSGSSWLAASQWFIASECPPHLTAIAPWEGFTDQFRHMTNRGGIPAPTFTEIIITTTFAGENFVEDVARMSIGQQVINEYWQDKIARLDRITVPAYIVASYTNPLHTHGTFAGFRSIRSKDKWLRVHNTFEWPDYYDRENLEDLRKNDWPQTPLVRIAVLDPGHEDSVNRPVESWPVPGFTIEKLHLHSAGTLSKACPTTDNTISYECEGTENYATFSYVFDDEVELIGHMNLRLWVEAIGSSDMELLVLVEKRDGGGDTLAMRAVGGEAPSTILAKGLLRVSHRALDAKLSTELEPFYTHEHEELLKPGQIVPIELGIWPTALRFHPGEQLTLTIRPAPVVPVTFDNKGFGLSTVPVPSSGMVFTPGAQVSFAELGGAPDSDPVFVKEQRVQTPPGRNKGIHVFHFGAKYPSALLVPFMSNSKA